LWLLGMLSFLFDELSHNNTSRYHGISGFPPSERHGYRTTTFIHPSLSSPLLSSYVQSASRQLVLCECV
jgi:hypothetical protein